MMPTEVHQKKVNISVLLRQELAWVNRNEERIVENARILRGKCFASETYHIHKRCLNLKLLETKAEEFVQKI